MSIYVTFPGGKRVDANLGDYVVRTDQSPQHGGDGSAPEPFDLFLASLATCAGIYVLGFCQARAIDTANIHLIQQYRINETTGRVDRIELEIILPAGFPPKYRVAVERAAAGCKIKKLLLSPPEVVVVARIQDVAAAV
jgi:ribosomal protein S12 methylthiotransferase accessory factor